MTRLLAVDRFCSRTAIILSLLLSPCIVHVHCSVDGVDSSRDAEREFLKEWLSVWEDDDDDTYFSPEGFILYRPQIPEMKSLSCYQCSELESVDGHMACDLIRDTVDFQQFFQNNPEFVEEMKMAKKIDGTWEWDNLLGQKFQATDKPNPCKLIANKVLELVEAGVDHSIPIYLDVAGKDSKTRYDSLRDAISTIQFQRRGSSDWIAVEVQLRDKEGLFSFILPDLEPEFLDIPENSIFYASL